MSGIAKMTDYEHLQYLKKCLENRTRLTNLEKELSSKLKSEKKHSAFKKAGKLFSFPFKKEAFGALFEAFFVVLVSILFAGCTLPVLLAVVFCVLVDFLYIIAFGVFYPFLVLYFVIFKGHRIKKIEKKIINTKNELEKCPSADVLKKQLEVYEKKHTSSSRSSSGSHKSGVENTEWYKNKADEYYRLYMGFPPKDEDGLSSLATDPTLDLHPGDY